MVNDLFIDGIIFGEKIFGGVARMWEEIIPRLQSRHIPMTLLMPLKNNFPSVDSLGDYVNIINDYFFWPKRVFDKVGLRSKLLTQFYKASNARIFHSTYFSTIASPKTLKFVTVYDMIYEIFESQAPSKWAEQVLHNKRKSIENADQIICISESTKQDLLKFFPSLIEEKIAVIYPGISILSRDNLNDSSTEISKKYGYQFSRQGYFLVVGKLDGYKNFQLIVDLLNQNEKARNFKFLCVGSGKTSKVREIASHNYPENFIFIDFVKDEELALLYHNAIGLIYPSLYEGFGLPVVEAMSNSCPVACSSASSLPEAGGDAAFYFDPLSTAELYERLIDLMDCNRDQLIIKGLAQAQKFSWEKTVSAQESLYRKML